MTRTNSRILLLPLVLLLGACNRGEGGAEHGQEGPARGADEDPGDEHAGHGEVGEEGAHEEGVVDLPEGSAVDVQLARVERRPLAPERTTTGQVDYVQSAVAHVSPRVPGRVHRVLAHIGDDVRVGQAVAELDSIEVGAAKAAYVQAKTREDLARRTFEREKALHEERISSEREKLEAEAAWQEAHSATEAAAQTLRLYGLDAASIGRLGAGSASALVAVQAPLAGSITEHHVTVGELVTPETRLMTVADLSRVWVWIDIPERDVAAVHPDDDVEVTSDAYPQERFTGKVSYLTPEVDRDARTVRARIEAANPGRRLLPGMFVSVRISDPHGPSAGGGGSLAVPARAIQRDGDESIVFVATGPRRYERRAIRVGRSAGAWTEVLEGVAEGDEVVVEGAFILKSEAARHELGGGHSH